MDNRTEPPSAARLGLVFLRLGTVSFGGGSATLMQIRREVVDRHGWIGEDTFTRDWALCQATPGINLLGITLLVGYRLRGVPGAVFALLGLLLPSVLITVLFTATYSTFRDSPLLSAALKGIVPATVGLGLLNAVQMARPLLDQSRIEGPKSTALSLFLLVGAGAIALFHVPVSLVLLSAALIGALAHWRLPLRAMTKVEAES